MLGLGLIALACALWALDTLIRYPLLQKINAYDVVLIEHMFLVPIMLGLFYSRTKGIFKLKFKNFFDLFVIGGLGSALATLSFTKAMTLINPSIVILLQKFQPVLAIFFARFILKEELKLKFLLWATLAFVATLIIGIEDFLKIFEHNMDLEKLIFSKSALQGHFFALLATLGWALSTVFGKKLENEGVESEVIMLGRFSMGLMTLTILGLFYPGLSKFDRSDTLVFQSLFSQVDSIVLGQISLMVVMSGLLAMYLYYQGLLRMKARSAALGELFFPVMAVIVNWIFLDQALSFFQIMGSGLLVLSAVAVQTRENA